MRKIIGLIFVALVLLALGWLLGRGEETRVYRVAVVQLTEVELPILHGMKSALSESGWRENENIIYLNQTPAGNVANVDSLLKQQLALAPDLIFSSSTAATLVAKRLAADSGIPLLFASVNDPVAAGVLHDLKKPEGNLTGIRLPTGDDLRLRWLTKIAPGVRQVLVPYSPADKSAQASLIIIRQAAQQLNLRLHELPINQVLRLEQLLHDVPANIDAVFLPRDSIVESHIDSFVRFSYQRGLPLAAPSFSQVKAGALFSYGFIHTEIGRQSARLAAQILSGTKPVDLPVEMAENYLTVNMQAARMIGIEIPDNILLQADFIVGQTIF
jgi:putative tryptophan/tyrosine transport system substrate-binding protein